MKLQFLRLPAAWGAILALSILPSLTAQSAGLTWTRITPEGVGTGAALAYGAGTYVMLGGSAVALSQDAVSWTTAALGGPGSGLAYGGGVFVATFRGSSGETQLVATSRDGRMWTRRTTGAGALNAVAHNGERFVAIGEVAPAGSVAVSADGSAWQRMAAGTPPGVLRGIAGNAALKNFVAWGSQTPELWVSRDGATWTRTTLPGAAPTERPWGVAAAGRGYVAAARLPSGEAKLFTSSDGTTWVAGSTLASGNSVSGLGVAASDRALDGSGAVVVATAVAGISQGTLVVYGRVLALSSAGPLTTWNSASLALDAIPGTSVPMWTGYANGYFLMGDSSLKPGLYRAKAGPVFAEQPPETLAVESGGRLALGVATTESGVTYQWFHHGAAIPGATAATLAIERASAADEGDYFAVARDATGRETASTRAAVTVKPSGNPPRIVNLSILTAVSAEAPLFKLGTVLGGAGTRGNKPVVIRAVGPTLAGFGVGAVLADPRVAVLAGSGSTAPTVAGNDDWGGGAALGDAMARVGAFALAPGSRDAAVAPEFPAGDYVVEIDGAAAAPAGAVLAEIYDGTPTGGWTGATPRLINVSVLKHIGAGLTVGFVIGGDGGKTVLVRAVGPGLAGFGVAGTVADPQLALFDSAARQIAANDDWGGTTVMEAAFRSVGAFGLAATSKDAALLATLPPGAYTVQISGGANGTGTALVEVYEVP